MGFVKSRKPKSVIALPETKKSFEIWNGPGFATHCQREVEGTVPCKKYNITCDAPLLRGRFICGAKNGSGYLFEMIAQKGKEGVVRLETDQEGIFLFIGKNEIGTRMVGEILTVGETGLDPIIVFFPLPFVLAEKTARGIERNASAGVGAFCLCDPKGERFAVPEIGVIAENVFGADLNGAHE